MPKGEKRKSANGEPQKDKGKGLVAKSARRSGTRRNVAANGSEDTKLTSIDESSAKPSCLEISQSPSNTQSGTNINQLSDEMLLKIFSMVDSKSVFHNISRVCKRWHLLTKDKHLWRCLDLSFMGLKPKSASSAIRQFCSEVTRTLALRAESTRYRKDATKRTQYTAPKCLTRYIVTTITKKCPKLQKLSISYEQISGALSPPQQSFVSCLPNTLTHLSLAHCNLLGVVFDNIFDKDSPLKHLVSLDLSSVCVQPRAHLFEALHQLPPKLTALSVRDVSPYVPLMSFTNIIVKQENLLFLDIGINHIDIALLTTLSTNLKNLGEFDMSGCLLADCDATSFQAFEYDPVEKEDWQNVYRNGFPSITRLNIRNVRQNDGELLFNCLDGLSPDVAHVIDTDGASRGEWSSGALHASRIEKEKYSFGKRFEREQQEYARSFRYSRHRGLFRNFRNVWADPFLDSSDEDGIGFEDSDEEEDHPYDPCSLM